MLIGCNKNSSSSQEGEHRRFTKNSHTEPHPKKHTRRRSYTDPLEYELYFAEPDVQDIPKYQNLLSKGTFKASQLFNLANSCEDARIREHMLNSFFSHYGRHNSIIVLDYLGKLDPGGFKLGVIRRYAGSINDPNISEKVFDWVESCQNTEEQNTALGAMGLLMSKIETNDLVGMEQKYTGKVLKLIQQTMGYRYATRDDELSRINNILDTYGKDSVVTLSYISTLSSKNVNLMAERINTGDIPATLLPIVTQSVVDQYMRESYSKACHFIDEFESDDKSLLYNRLYTMWLVENFEPAVDSIYQLPHSNKQREGVKAIIRRLKIQRDIKNLTIWEDWMDQNYPYE